MEAGKNNYEKMKARIHKGIDEYHDPDSNEVTEITNAERENILIYQENIAGVLEEIIDEIARQKQEDDKHNLYFWMLVKVANWELTQAEIKTALNL